MPIFVEIFAGRGTLSRAAIQAGFTVLSIDHDASAATVPMVLLDLTTKTGEAILWDILSSNNVLGVHMGLPCGTASLARERPVAASLRALGVPNPPPLRSAQHPLGLPNLSSFHQAKVDAANQLYRLGVEILVYCHRRGIVVSIENPATSWIWAALVRISLEHSDEAARVLNSLERVEFHACCHGSTRRKHTAWLGTDKVFSQLAAVCNYDHPHDAWGVRWTANGWVFDTSTEAAYPALLAQRVVSCLIQEAKARHISLDRPLRLHDAATAVQGKQSKRHKPLIPEFHHFAKQPAGAVLQSGSKLLAPHLGGDLREEPCQNSADGASLSNDSEKFDKVGFYHNPKQFVSLAMGVQHPMDATEHLEAVTRYALEFNLQYPPQVVMLERKKNLLQARLLAKQCEQQEKQLHENLPPSLQKVLRGKQLLVWKKLLERYEYDDMQVYDFMASGVKLTGMHDTPACYPEKIRPATLTQGDLEASAVWRRKAIVGRKFLQKDPLHAAHLEETAAEELDLGFLEGPFRSEAEVSAYFGHSHWMVVRRFVLVQGSEMKLRPIDDCLESQLNQAYTSTSYLKLQDLDYVTSLALRIAEAVSENRQKHGSGRWLGKCLDLSKAYKQMGIDPEQRHLAVIFFTKADGQPVFYVANALMFGAAAAVYAFNRVSRSLWFLLNRMLAIPCGVFYDDFPLFAPEELAQDTDACASELLDLLGWRHARTGPKGKPFERKFQVLGCTLDLTDVAQGVLVAENKPGRIDRLLMQLESIKAANSISLHEAQVLHGLMRYACGFFSGRHLHQVCAEVLALCSSSTKRSNRGIGDFCDYASSTLRDCRPRTIAASCEKRPFLIFTDGSWEGGHAGIGAVAIDTASGEKFVWAGQVPQTLLERWRCLVGEQLICQIELYAMVVIRWMLADRLKDRRTIWWVDNDAARYATIKGISPSAVMRCLVRQFYHFETSAPTYSWVERIPSYSNPADAPSRGCPEEAMKLLQVGECKPFDHPAELINKLLLL
jgi:hypothetical protein